LEQNGMVVFGGGGDQTRSTKLSITI